MKNKIGVKKINSFLKELPVVKYKACFDSKDSKEGELVDAHVVSDNGDKALLYLATNFRDDECGCFMLCKREGKGKDANFIDCGDDYWINLI